ncbi:MAG: hypothetical protein AAGD32_16495 [Planctomycetota bacterium]
MLKSKKMLRAVLLAGSAMLLTVPGVSAEPAPATEPVALTIQTSAPHRLAVGVPEGWTVDPADPNQLFLYAPLDGPEDDFSENMNFLRIDVPAEQGQVTIPMLRQGALTGQQQLAQQFDGFETTPVEDVAIAGRPGLVMTYKMSVDGIEMTGRQWYLLTGPQSAVIATVTTRRATFDRYAGLAGRVMESVQLAEEAVNQPADPLAGNAPAAGNAPVPAGPVTHDSPRYGLSVDLVNAWRVDESNPTQLTIFAPQEGGPDNFGENLGIRQVPKPVAEGPITIDEMRPIMDASVAQLGAQYPGLQATEPAAGQTAGAASLMMDVEFETQGVSLKVRQWYILLDPQVAVVATYTSAADKFDATVPDAQAIVDSVRLLR